MREISEHWHQNFITNSWDLFEYWEFLAHDIAKNELDREKRIFNNFVVVNLTFELIHWNASTFHRSAYVLSLPCVFHINHF